MERTSRPAQSVGPCSTATTTPPTPAIVDDETVRVGFDCVECGAALVLVVASALPDALGMDLTVERRE